MQNVKFHASVCVTPFSRTQTISFLMVYLDDNWYLYDWIILSSVCVVVYRRYYAAPLRIFHIYSKTPFNDTVYCITVHQFFAWRKFSLYSRIWILREIFLPRKYYPLRMEFREIFRPRNFPPRENKIIIAV